MSALLLKGSVVRFVDAFRRNRQGSGLNSIKLEDPPTCAYIMVGKKCRGTCLFCAQRTEPGEIDNGESSHFLSRITWKPEDDGKVLEAIVEKYNEGSMKRVCFQAVQGEGMFRKTLESLKSLKNACAIPVCVSINGISGEQLRELYEAGAENIAFSFDAATPELFEKIKGTPWIDEWNLYEETNRLFPGRTVIHLIAGLGETEEEMARAVAAFYLGGSEVSLFAFTPIPGTPLAKKKQPPINSYRKLQAALFLIRTIGMSPVDKKDAKNELSTQLTANSCCSSTGIPACGESPGTIDGETAINYTSTNFAGWSIGEKESETEELNRETFHIDSGIETAEKPLNKSERESRNKVIPGLSKALSPTFSITSIRRQADDAFNNENISLVFEKLRDYLSFEDGRIIFNPDKKKPLLNLIPGEAFQTWGCPDCNRPLYNERPGKTPYNYPRELTDKEREEAVESIFS